MIIDANTDATEEHWQLHCMHASDKPQASYKKKRIHVPGISWKSCNLKPLFCNI